MLSAQARLRRSTDIATVLRRGSRHTSEFIVLHVLREAGDSTRVAFAVGKNVGNSVVRHRVTRQLRHLAHDEMAGLPAGSHVVVRALPGCGQAPFSSLRDSMTAALAKAARS
jgi:ribonuclease P protein component